MKYIFFCIITITIFSLFFYKNYIFQLGILISSVLTLMVVFPQASLNAAKNGIDLWLFIVIPSLLPFFIINDMLIALKIPESIGKIFSPIARLLFNTSGYGAYVFIMSIFSGYPAGAKITSQLIESGKIGNQEGQRILTFSSTSGPLFIIGAVGAGMLQNSAAGYILFIAHILGSIINGVMFRLFFKEPVINKVKLSSHATVSKNFSDILSKAISNSLITSGFIGGYIILFSVIIDLLNKVEFFEILYAMLLKLSVPDKITDIITRTLESSIEISNGCKILSQSNFDFRLTLCLISFIIAFSGFSIIGQVSSVITNTKINLKIYIISKISHGFFSAISCFWLLKFNIISLETSTWPDFSVKTTLPLLLVILLFLIMFLNMISNLKVIKSKR